MCVQACVCVCVLARNCMFFLHICLGMSVRLENDKQKARGIEGEKACEREGERERERERERGTGARVLCTLCSCTVFLS